MNFASDNTCALDIWYKYKNDATHQVIKFFISPFFSMDAIIGSLSTLDELAEWAKLWNMEDDEQVKNRRVEILQQIASTSTFMDDVAMPAGTEK